MQETIQQLQMLLLKLWRITTLDWDVDLAWYSLNATFQICLYVLEHSFKMHGFRPIWPCLIIEVLTTQAKSLEASGSSTMIKCIFTFYTTNVFSSFHSVMAQFKLVKHMFLNYSTVHIHLCSFQITCSEAMLSESDHLLLWYYQPYWVPTTAWTVLVMWYTWHKLVCTKNFDSP